NSVEKDAAIRPNQIWAVSLPFTMLDREKEKKVVDKVLEELYTPYGLRSLSVNHEEYKSIYIGEVFTRDMAYHQGTTWSFPLGAFMSSYCKVNDYSEQSVQFVDGLLMDMENHIKDDCLGGIAEILDGDSPHAPRGCYSQAWGVGEMLRVYYEDVLGNRK
ncbi:MAG: amylo-alpha-1,6-glucosidase, partial [Clostridium sp.]